MQPTTQISFSPLPTQANRNESRSSTEADRTTKFEDVFKKHLPVQPDKNASPTSPPKRNLNQTSERLAKHEQSTTNNGTSAENNISDRMDTKLSSKIKPDGVSIVSEEEKAALLDSDELISLISGAGTPGFYLQNEQPSSSFAPKSKSTDTLSNVGYEAIGKKDDHNSTSTLSSIGIEVENDEISPTLPGSREGFQALMDRSPTGEKTSQNMPADKDNGFTAVRIDQPLTALAASEPPREHLTAGLIHEHIPSPVGSNKWGNDVGQKVVWMINNEETSATLTLNPPDLGPMKVVVHVENGQAHASFSADQPEVRQALLDSIPKLREVMENAGISLGQTNVSHSNSGGQDSNGGDHKRKSGTITSIDSDLNEDASLNTSVTTIARRGLVDTFA